MKYISLPLPIWCKTCYKIDNKANQVKYFRKTQTYTIYYCEEHVPRFVDTKEPRDEYQRMR